MRYRVFLGFLVAAGVFGAMHAEGQDLSALDPVFTALQHYEYGQDSTALATLEHFIQQCGNVPGQTEVVAARLTAMLSAPDTTPAAKQFVCRHLPFVATAECVPVLAAMLREPETAEMARQALQAIGSPESLALLNTSDGESAGNDAEIRRAEQWVAEGKLDLALQAYTALYTSSQPAHVRLAGLRGLVSIQQGQALPLVIETIVSEDPALSPHAIRLAVELPEPGVTLALTDTLPKLSPPSQALLIAALADRGDRAALSAVAPMMSSEDIGVRTAAAGAMAMLGDAAVIPQLAGLAAAETGPAQAAARKSLARMTAPGADAAIAAAIPNVEPAARVELIDALAARGTPGISEVLLQAAADADVGVRVAAWKALSTAALAETYPKLVTLFASVSDNKETVAARAALAAVGGRVENPAQPILTRLTDATPAQQANLLSALPAFGGVEPLNAVRARLADPDKTICDAAVRALADWPEEAAADDLIALAQTVEDPVYRTLALRGYMRLARSSGARLAMLQKVQAALKTAADKQQLLAALADIPEPEALDMAVAMLNDPDAAAEAEQAVLKIAPPIVRTQRDAVQKAMKSLIEATKNEQTAKDADVLLRRAAARVDCLTPAPYGQDAIDARRAQVQAAAPTGCALICYADCGIEGESTGPDGQKLAQIDGAPHIWPGSADAAPGPFASIAFDGGRVTFELTGLKPDKGYILGFSWWDYD
ncbi:MAG: ThuA protein, partial [Candidatus Hydrogenedentes bacterium]|nr:ThuA protein [Candidatus Hydrogenedentota bacterium]